MFSGSLYSDKLCLSVMAFSFDKYLELHIFMVIRLRIELMVVNFGEVVASRVHSLTSHG